jgi:hypothetical protein
VIEYADRGEGRVVLVSHGAAAATIKVWPSVSSWAQAFESSRLPASAI